MKHHGSRNTFKEYIDYQTGSNAPKTKMVLGPSAKLSNLEYHTSINLKYSSVVKV